MARYYTKDGREIDKLREARKANAFPSVTTVINAMAPHEYKYLEGKRLREVLENDGLEYENKMELLGNSAVFEDGTLVHEGAEIFLDTGIRSTLLDCPNSSKQLYDLYSGLEVHSVERKVISKRSLKAGGRLDLLAYEGKRLSLIDLKTVMATKTKPSKTWLMQLGAYYVALKEEGIQVDKGTIVQFNKKDLGTSTLHITLDEMEAGAAMFHSARSLFKYFYNI